MRSYFVGAALAALVGVAGAQSVDPTDFTPTAITVRGGIVLPLDSSLTDLDNLLLNLGVEYQIPRPLLRQGETFFSLDYWAASFQGDRGSVIPIMLNHRWYDRNDMVPGARTYWFFGLGAAVIDLTSANTAFAARAGIGKELGERIIFETAGWLTDKVGGVRANAFAFNIGYRF